MELNTLELLCISVGMVTVAVGLVWYLMIQLCLNHR